MTLVYALAKDFTYPEVQHQHSFSSLFVLIFHCYLSSPRLHHKYIVCGCTVTLYVDVTSHTVIQELKKINMTVTTAKI